jgi:erythronate-4-phosphate dehydrogenase
VKIIADQSVPLVTELFGPYGDVQLLSGREISAVDIVDADILLVRSVTQVDANLLEGSPVKFVGSATIGTDHVDLDYLQAEGVCFAHAPGCNAQSVVQYDFSVMTRLMPDWQTKTVGIVGCGNVGGRLLRALLSIGVDCRVYDPYLAGDSGIMTTDFESVLDSDILCLHTPLTVSGLYPTFHLLDATALSKLKPGALLINAGRGAVVDNKALLDLLKGGVDLVVALDVWEPEPMVDVELLQYVSMASPHIAGYSLEGKVNGTSMIFDTFVEWQGTRQNKSNIVKLDDMAVCPVVISSVEDAILASFDISADDNRMRLILEGIEPGSPRVGAHFDQLRKEYPVRREWASMVFNAERLNLSMKDRLTLTSLGFNLC